MGRLLKLFCIFISITCSAYCQPNSSSCYSNYCVTGVHDYSFDELIDEGINTTARQLEILNIPVRQLRFIIKWHIKMHNFALNKKEREKAVFRAISFTYPSVSPEGEKVLLSGLVTLPILPDSKPLRMYIYNRPICASYKIYPSNCLPIVALLTADNTICVCPDYYGFGATEGKPVPYVAFNYLGQCAAECALAALDIIRDNGIALEQGFYTWSSGYSQGAGSTLAMHKYIENALPDSLQQRINLRWSLCGGGIYSPAKLYESLVISGDMGNMPSIFFQSLSGLFSAHYEQLDNFSMRDIFLKKTLIIDSLLSISDGLWDLNDKLGKIVKSHNPADYFNSFALDTAATLYKALQSAFLSDGCDLGWRPRSPVLLIHSKNDKIIPFQLTQETYNQLSEKGNCSLVCPKISNSHYYTGFLYYAKLLRFREDEIFDHFKLSLGGGNSE